jgi:hypothetical protein
MTQRNEHIELAMEELERYGLRGEVSERGKHLEIAWTTPHGRRFVIAPKTPSDWRGGLNLRSDLRKLLRADNLQVKQINNLSFQKAMSLPKQPIVTRELLLQNDVDALSDLVFELQSQIASLHDKMNSMRVVAKIEFNQVEERVVDDTEILDTINQLVDKAQNPFRLGSTQAKIFETLTHQYKSFLDIVKESGIGYKYVANTLTKAKKKGFCESGLRGQWRRKV